jgi:hypothetical protein
MTHRLSSILPLLLLALGGCGESECDCIAPSPEVTAVIITGVPLVPIRVGNRVRLTADVKSTGVLADTRVIWRTSAPTVLEVEQDGLVTAVGIGTATVEAIASADTTKRGSALIRVEAVAGATVR